MTREIATALVLGAALAGGAAGQQSITASATILERVEAEAISVEVRSHEGRLSVAQSATQSAKGTRLLRSTFVSGGEAADGEATVPVRVRAEGALRLDRRPVQMGVGSGEKVGAGETLLIDVAETLTITRIIASNS